MTLRMNEIYQNKTNRLVYTHSVDVYILLALLYGYREKNKPTIIEKCKFYIDCAERTDWRYQGFVHVGDFTILFLYVVATIIY